MAEDPTARVTTDEVGGRLRIGERIAAARREQFVGRESESDLLRSALLAPRLPFSLCYLHGPGGVGKTALLQSFAAQCERLNIPAFSLDARNIRPSPDSFVDALRSAMKLPASADPLASLGSFDRRGVLLVDTFEVLGDMAGWVRDVLLPDISADILIVAAGRQPPAVAWPEASGWSAVLRSVSLRNFTDRESEKYLAARGVPDAAHAAAFRFTHGHPLALSLIADLHAQSPEGLPPFLQGDAPPEVIHTLLQRFLGGMPGGIRTRAIEACALVRGMTEGLLEAMLFPELWEESADGAPDAATAAALFDWLRSLSFIESGPSGLFPHDIAREALLADLRWRNRDGYVELHRRARLYYTRQLQQAGSAGWKKRVLHDCLFLHRDSGVVGAAFAWDDMPGIIAGPPRPGDAAAILAMVARHEGEESARIAAHWLDAQPEATVVLRAPDDSQPVAFFTLLALEKASPSDGDADPATRDALRFVAEHGALRPGEGATYLRFWMTRDTHQAASPLQSLVIVQTLHHFLTKGSRLAYTFFCCHDAPFWEPVFQYAGIARLAEGFLLGGHHYGVFGHDWRGTPVMEWVARMAEKQIDAAGVYHAIQKAGGVTENAPQAAPLPAALDATAFAAATREALRDMHRPDRLAQNPLTRSRLAARTGGAALPGESDRAEALRTNLLAAAETLNVPDPRRKRAYIAVYHAYLNPVCSQEEAAKQLDLPFSTFRRHLAEGLAAVTERLWQKEIGGPGHD